MYWHASRPASALRSRVLLPSGLGDPRAVTLDASSGGGLPRGPKGRPPRLSERLGSPMLRRALELKEHGCDEGPGPPGLMYGVSVFEDSLLRVEGTVGGGFPGRSVSRCYNESRAELGVLLDFILACIDCLCMPCSLVSSLVGCCSSSPRSQPVFT